MRRRSSAVRSRASGCGLLARDHPAVGRRADAASGLGRARHLRGLAAAEREGERLLFLGTAEAEVQAAAGPAEVEQLQKLAEDGLEKGFLNYDEIATGLEDLELSKEQVDGFYTYLIDHGVELVEGETHKHPPHEQPQPEEEKAPKLDLGVEPSLDSLRLYLREIGKVPLLTADPGGVSREADRARRHG